jgi:hypothetical protein
LYVGQSGSTGLVTVGIGPRDVEVPIVEELVEAVKVVEEDKEAPVVLEGLDPETEISTVVLIMLVEVVVTGVEGDGSRVEEIVEAVVANMIGGAKAPVTMIAASDRSFAPALTTPMLLFSMHWLLDAVMSKLTATHTLPAGPLFREVQAAIHPAKLDPLMATRLLPVSAVLQRMR